MKKTTLFLYLFSIIFGLQQSSAQTYSLLESFAGTGLEGDFGGTSAVYATDPAGAGQVIMLTSNPGEVWQGLNVILPVNYKLTAATQLSMQLDVYSTAPITIAPKAQGGVAGAPESITTATHNGSGWQTLTFTFNQSLDGKVPANGDYSDFALHINWNTTSNSFGAPDGRIFYIKNLKGLPAAPPPPTGPTVAAPTPPARPTADVISLFSDAYTNIVVDNWNQAPIWYAPTGKPVLDVLVASNPTKKIEFAGDGFIGVILNAYNNATNLTHFHMDYFIPSGTDLTGKVLNPKWSNHTNMAGEVNALLLTNIPTTAGSWVSVDVELSTFTPQGPNPSLNRESLKEFLIQSNLGDVYIDNIYLHKNTVLKTSSFESLNVKMYPNPAKSFLNIDAISNVESVSVFNLLGQEVISQNPNSKQVVLDVSSIQSGVYVIKTSIDGVISSSRFVKE